MKKKKFERERTFCVGKLCIKWEKELQIYNKKMGIRKAKNKKKIK